ncbi:protein FAR-RED ELONGATED HYPOCOTYL 3-like [Carya illinoinensis]|uniref:protein FAR-RED ELONGATED HYPOCOTYL 3-like n=1 Tax=Carya illinoinensis TaxID=32201 RepID=UPI001C71DFB0|nr:protein FAR-RED ELONGATED HYPOCOTYL 3-like [Carya illinoinensis]
MNAFFDGYVHAGTTLKEFVDQFDNALRKKVEVETTTDFNSSNQTIPCVSPFNIEKQFQKVYTNAKFKEVQRELMGLMCCNCWLVSTQGCILTFDVLDEISFDEQTKRVHYSVYYNEDECEVKCTCGLFEMRGIICRHALRVCQLKNINVLPDVYFLDRWRKDLKRHYTLIRSSYDDLRGRSDTRNYELMIQRCSKLAAKISSNNDKVHAFLHYVDKFDKTCEDSTCELAFQSTQTNPTVVLDKGKKILSPNVIRGKGRPPNKRKVPPVEKMATKRKKQDGVGETIAGTLWKEGINFWMLTGDKQNTAMQIALSSNFVPPTIRLEYLADKMIAEILRFMNQVSRSNNKNRGLQTSIEAILKATATPHFVESFGSSAAVSRLKAKYNAIVSQL